MTEILMMTLTPQLRKIAIKKKASHPSSIREPDSDLIKLVDKIEQAKITMKLEERDKKNKMNDSDTELSEKIIEFLNIYEKNPNVKGKPSFIVVLLLSTIRTQHC